MAQGKKKQEEEQIKGQTEDQKLSLEDSFDELDQILEALEQDDISLEDSFAMYQKGMTLLKSCNEKIDTVEKKILIMNEDGGFDEF